jgi:hypothetical protein
MSARKTIALDEKLNVEYVIPIWLRDEQIKLACARPIGRLQPQPRREESIAVVGFGPSLQETWEKVRDFPFVVSCSGAHRFLIDRGIIPNWHVEVDPRAHKITLMGAPHPSVEYLVASTCAPAYFDHLADSNVKLWHIFDGSEDGVRMLPPGDWAVTGGCDAGLRSMTMAAFLGFRDLHVFGLDGCARGENRHAGDHPYGKQKYAEVIHNGKTYYTTPAMLAAAKGTVHELEQMPAVRATFYGEGLTQELARGYEPKKDEPTDKPFANVIGLFKPPVISPDYVKLNAQLHRDNLAYGVGGAKHAAVVRKLAVGKKSVLDYGCGKGKLGQALDFPIWEYDPAIPGKDASPRPAELVVCTDVLEHIEPELLQGVLMDLRRVTKSIGYFVIHTGPAQKMLADGRNAHLIQHGEAWWRKNLAQFFTVANILKKGPELHVIVASKAPKGKRSV